MKDLLRDIPSPCYVIDENLLRRNLEKIKEVGDKSGVEIIVAFKGFATWSVFPVVKEYISGAAASSVHEAHLANEEMHTSAHTYSPAYTTDDIDELMHLSSHITFNSFSQYQLFAERIKSRRSHVSLGIRINPEYSEVDTDLYNPCSPGSRLGVSIEHMPEKLPEYIEGLHFHTLCESGANDLVNTLNAVEEKFGNYLKQVKWINMGGGHLISHKDYDTALLISLLNNFKEKYGLKIILETGAAFAWETGYLVSSVVDVVENRNIKTAILDVSFTAHMPDCLEMPYKPNILGAVPEEVSDNVYRIGGNSCLSGDFMGNWGFERKLEPGDRIVFNDMIHYTMVKTTTFNGVKHPSIGIIDTKGNFSLIREFGYADYKSRLS